MAIAPTTLKCAVQTSKTRMSPQIPVPHEAIAAFCRSHHIARLSFYGSVLRDDFSPGSDVDVLVEFEPGQAIGYFGLARMEDELSALLGRRVDLREPGELSRHFRNDVLAQAEVEFAQV